MDTEAMDARPGLARSPGVTRRSRPGRATASRDGCFPPNERPVAPRAVGKGARHVMYTYPARFAGTDGPIKKEGDVILIPRARPSSAAPYPFFALRALLREAVDDTRARVGNESLGTKVWTGARVERSREATRLPSPRATP
eukprot:1668242-Pyramimonas_sp.AAC.2